MRHTAWQACNTAPRFHLHLYLAIGLLLVGCIALRYVSHPAASPTQIRLQELPLRLGAWDGTEKTWGPEMVTALAVDDWTLRLYQHASGAWVWLYIGWLERFTLAQESHHSPRRCYPANGWQVVRREEQQITLPGHSAIVVNKLLVQKNAAQRLVLYWQQWGDRIGREQDQGIFNYRDELLALRYVLSGLVHHDRTDRALVRISSPVAGSVEATLSHQIAFIQDAFPALRQHFVLAVSPP